MSESPSELVKNATDCVQYFPENKFGVASVHAFDNSKLTEEQLDNLSKSLFDENLEEISEQLSSNI